MRSTHYLMLSTLLLLTACESKAGTGALVGAGGGAVLGGALGGGQGALIGAAAGAVGGAIIGAALDASDRDNLQQNSPDTLNRIDNGQQLTIQDIENMARAGIKDSVIINQIDATHSVFHLSADQIVQLKNAGVSQNVIDHMIRTGR